MRIEVETYDIENEDTVMKTAYILNHFDVEFEAGDEDDDTFIYLDVTDEELCDYHLTEGVEFSLFHDISKKDIEKYGSSDRAYMEYKNALPILLYILIDSTLYCYEIEHIYIRIGVDARYRMYNRYDVSNTDTFKKMNMLGIPEDGLTDKKIKQMIEQGTKISIVDIELKLK